MYNVIFLSRNVFNSNNSYRDGLQHKCASYFYKDPTIEKIRFQNNKRGKWISNHTWLDQVIKGMPLIYINRMSFKALSAHPLNNLVLISQLLNVKCIAAWWCTSFDTLNIDYYIQQNLEFKESKNYDIRLQIYNDLKIRVWEKWSVHLRLLNLSGFARNGTAKVFFYKNWTASQTICFT